jgi:hypothetical protein
MLLEWNEVELASTESFCFSPSHPAPAFDILGVNIILIKMT